MQSVSNQFSQCSIVRVPPGRRCPTSACRSSSDIGNARDRLFIVTCDDCCPMMPLHTTRTAESGADRLDPSHDRVAAWRRESCGLNRGVGVAGEHCLANLPHRMVHGGDAEDAHVASATGSPRPIGRSGRYRARRGSTIASPMSISMQVVDGRSVGQRRRAVVYLRQPGRASVVIVAHMYGKPSSHRANTTIGKRVASRLRNQTARLPSLSTT